MSDILISKSDLRFERIIFTAGGAIAGFMIGVFVMALLSGTL